MKKSQWKWKAWKKFFFPLLDLIQKNIRNGSNSKSMKTHPYIMVLFVTWDMCVRDIKEESRFISSSPIRLHLQPPHFLLFLSSYIKKESLLDSYISWCHFFVLLYIFLFISLLPLLDMLLALLLFLLMAMMMMLMAYTYEMLYTLYRYVYSWFNQWVIIAEWNFINFEMVLGGFSEGWLGNKSQLWWKILWFARDFEKEFWISLNIWGIFLPNSKKLKRIFNRCSCLL